MLADLQWAQGHCWSIATHPGDQLLAVGMHQVGCGACIAKQYQCISPAPIPVILLLPCHCPPVAVLLLRSTVHTLLPASSKTSLKESRSPCTRLHRKHKHNVALHLPATVPQLPQIQLPVLLLTCAYLSVFAVHSTMTLSTSLSALNCLMCCLTVSTCCCLLPLMMLSARSS